MAELLVQGIGMVPGTGAAMRVAPALSGAQSVPTEAQQKVTEEALKQAVAEAQRQFAGERIGFGYEKRLGLLYVQVYDQTTGKVLREFPPEEWLSQRAALSEWIGLLLDQRA